ncbi:hypothetical protein TG4357_03528 [Thalassovita gelatinovora]|uniref:Uncharacterized protein n=1 Tax=Thalassovita gelatinovora TaxID=53501 RepID=A0A0P1G8P3_THAGE|nr:hypothetical protein TG4357_03528 [Thalassovita gelatinovora]
MENSVYMDYLWVAYSFGPFNDRKHIGYNGPQAGGLV